MLRTRFMAASTAALLMLGMAVGGASAANAQEQDNQAPADSEVSFAPAVVNNNGGGGGGGGGGGPAPHPDNGATKVTVCHATPPDTAAQGWNLLSIDDDAAATNQSGHDQEHDADIIQAFSYWHKVGNGNSATWEYLSYPGKNLTTDFGGFTGAQILANDCVKPTPPPPPLTPTCTVVVWVMPSWINDRTPSWPQAYFASYPIDCGVPVDAPVPDLCGTQYQLDKYYDGPTTTALIAGGFLNGPNNPQEALVPGGWGSSYKLVKNPDCALATAAVFENPASCFSGSLLNEDLFDVSPGVTWVVVDPGSDTRQYEVAFTAPAASLFSDGTRTFVVKGDLDPVLGDEDCVFPITNVFLTFNDATCMRGQTLNVDSFVFDTELAELAGDPIIEEDGTYTVVFATIGLKTTFDQSPDVALPGRIVSNGGKTLTFTGTLAGPNTELCRALPVVDPFEYVDTCVTASFTLFYVEGLTYRVTINDDPSFDVVFAEGVTSKTFGVEPGDYVLAVPRANDGYVLGPDQPTPLDRKFTTYGPGDCQLPELPNWPASATATNQVCSPFGMNSGEITVQFSVGPISNLNPVRYYLAYGTPQQQELTSAVTPVASGDHLVTAVASISTDSVNDAGHTAVLPVTVGAASAENCDLPTLAFTGASDALTGIGALALLLTLVGAGVVVARRRQA